MHTLNRNLIGKYKNSCDLNLVPFSAHSLALQWYSDSHWTIFYRVKTYIATIYRDKNHRQGVFILRVKN